MRRWRVWGWRNAFGRELGPLASKALTVLTSRIGPMDYTQRKHSRRSTKSHGSANPEIPMRNEILSANRRFRLNQQPTLITTPVNGVRSCLRLDCTSADGQVRGVRIGLSEAGFRGESPCASTAAMQSSSKRQVAQELPCRRDFA